ncbi:MAG: 2-oxo acid dehydrogenase subunit E2, partial [Acidimicrobiales bacterium]
MAAEFVMPKLGLTMEAGTIVGWLVDEGAEVRPGQPVLVIETDKVESEVEAIGAGRLHQVGLVGEEYPCGASIGWLLADGEQPPAPSAPVAAAAAVRSTAPAAAADSPSQNSLGPAAATAATAVTATTGIGGRLLASPNAKRLAAARGIDLRTIAGTGPGGRITSEDVPTAPPPVAPAVSAPALPPASAPAPAGGGGGRLATAAARHLADLLGIDLGQVVPGGPDPRATKEDVAAHVRALLAAATTPPAPVSAGSALPAPLQEPSALVPLSGMRGTIAKRMGESLHSMAQLTLNMDVDMGGVAADRARRKQSAGPDGPLPGFTDYVIAATAAALVEHPGVKSQITEAGVASLPGVNIGMAVALDGGLIVPVIHDVVSFGLDELAAETSRLAAAARDRALTL